VTISPNQLPDDLDGLKRIIAALVQDAVATQAEIAKLRFQLARYRRAEFGRSSEKLARDAEQLELAIETLEADQAARLAAASPVVAAAIEAITEAQKPARRRLPERGSVNTAAARSSPIRIWYAPSSIALPHRIRCRPSCQRSPGRHIAGPGAGCGA